MHSLFLSPTNGEEVVDICSAFKAGTSSGFDDIKPDIVKAVIDLVKTPLTHVFNLSISSGIVPDDLKVARVVPIHKSGDATLPYVIIIVRFLFYPCSPKYLRVLFTKDCIIF